MCVIYAYGKLFTDNTELIWCMYSSKCKPSVSIIQMDTGKHKQLTYEEYFAFFHDHCADHLTVDQLNQVSLSLSPLS